MRVCLGGTFHPFHIGHEALLRRAFEGEEVFVGVTNGAIASRTDRNIPAWEKRAKDIQAFAEAQGYAGKLTVRALNDGIGPAATDYDAIVVSPETVPAAQRINELRKDNGLQPLAIWQVPHVDGEDRLPVSATAIAAGRIDRSGKRLGPIHVAVGSANPVKVGGVKAAFEAFLPDGTEVQGIEVPSGVAEQPQGAETLAGARARAVAALDMTGADYAVGVEAGLNQDDEGSWYDVQACVIIDRAGQETVGWGPAFQYPDWVLERARAGEMISDILGPVAGDDQIGGTTGALGFLTDGALDRTELTRAAVVMALVPRWQRALYAREP